MSNAPDRKQAAAVFLQALYRALHTIRRHPPASTKARQRVQALLDSLGPFADAEGGVQLRTTQRSLYLDDTPLPNDVGTFAYHQHVLTRLHEADVGAVRFGQSPSAGELETFLRLLEDIASPEPDPRKLERLQGGLSTRGLRSIELSPAQPFHDATTGLPTRDAAKRTYQKSVEVSRELFTGTELGRNANASHVRKAVQGIVEGVLTDQASLGSLSALKQYDDYLFTHAVNVCIYCVAIGRRLGLSKVQLYDLGHAALVHDLGMSRIPNDVLTKPSALDDQERRLMEAHTWLGALSVFELRDYGEIPLHSMIAAYEHHLRPDGKGYPQVRRKREPTIFSKIIAVAAAFDAATNERAYRPARPAEEVLLALWKDESLGYDPVIVKALINLLGIYPVGTVVILDSYELALVHAANSDAAYPNRPVVRLLTNPDGAWLDPAPLVDLADQDESGRFARTIIKVTSGERYGIDVSRYLG